MELQQVIQERRSVKNYDHDMHIDEEKLMSLVDLATYAPNHGMREPWRLVYVSKDKINEFAKKVATSAFVNDEKKQEQHIEKVSRLGGIFVILARRDTRQKENLENQMAVATFMQNLMLLIHEAGMGSCWKTPDYIFKPTFRDIVGANDDEDLYEACGTKDYRKMLDKQFKNNNSNFKIAVVVDMWITGFDVPSLAVMYIDKPLQKHTLIQTISRVNRVFEGKDKGLVVDYIGIKRNMMEAIKIYGGEQESPIDEIETSIKIFRNYLALIEDLFSSFDKKDYLYGEPLERLMCLNNAAEFIQKSNETEKEFMGLSQRLKAAYNICFPSGELTDREISIGQFYLAVRSIIYKQTRGNAPDAEVMNEVVEKMVAEAIQCTGVENIIDDEKSIDLFSEDFIEDLDQVKLPITKFNALLKLLRKAIKDYGKTNKIKALEFTERLKRVVEEYNNRDKLAFVSEVTEEFVNNLSDELIRMMRDLEEDKKSFEKMGITYEEKAFYDILINVRDKYQFPYADDKCIVLAKKIKELVDDKAQYTDWSNRNDIKAQLNYDLVILLSKNGYPPEWNQEVFEKVLEQAENFKANL